MFLLSILISVTSAVFAHAVTDFAKDARGVSWRGSKLKGADPRTFEPTCPQEILDRKGNTLFCAADAKNYFFGRNKENAKEKVEIDSYSRQPIKELGRNHFQLGRAVFFKDFGHELENADFATFNELEEEVESGIDSRRQWAADHRDVYCNGHVVTGLSPKGLAFWPFLSWDCKDLVSTQIGSALPSTGYIKDDGGVFIYMDCKLHMRLPDADPVTFTVPNALFPSRARDGKGHIYSCGNPVQKRRSKKVSLVNEDAPAEEKREPAQSVPAEDSVKSSTGL